MKKTAALSSCILISVECGFSWVVCFRESSLLGLLNVVSMHKKKFLLTSVILLWRPSCFSSACCGCVCVFPHVCLLSCRFLVCGVIINTPESTWSVLPGVFQTWLSLRCPLHLLVPFFLGSPVLRPPVFLLGLFMLGPDFKYCLDIWLAIQRHFSRCLSAWRTKESGSLSQGPLSVSSTTKMD